MGEDTARLTRTEGTPPPRKLLPQQKKVKDKHSPVLESCGPGFWRQMLKTEGDLLDASVGQHAGDHVVPQLGR